MTQTCTTAHICHGPTELKLALAALLRGHATHSWVALLSMGAHGKQMKAAQ